MRLEHRRHSWSDLRIGERYGEQTLLCLPVWRCQVGAAPILTHSTANHLCANAILSAGEAYYCLGCFATSITIRSCIKRVRPTAHGGESRNCIDTHCCRVEDHVDPSAQRRAALVALQRAHTAVARNERRRASSIE